MLAVVETDEKALNSSDFLDENNSILRKNCRFVILYACRISPVLETKNNEFFYSFVYRNRHA